MCYSEDILSHGQRDLIAAAGPFLGLWAANGRRRNPRIGLVLCHNQQINYMNTPKWQANRYIALACT